MIAATKALPRVQLGLYPTPITEAKRLSTTLGGPRILIKREDLSGLALGGNKCRKLEFCLAEAKRQGADAVISTASSQSNFCLQLAAAARKLDMKPSFVLDKGIHVENQGNLLLQRILDSDVEILELARDDVSADELSQRMDGIAAALSRKGYKPFIIRHILPDISAILGIVAWVDAADELATQLKRMDIKVDYVVLPSDGMETHTGLLLGSKYLGADYKFISITVHWNRDDAIQALLEKARIASDFLGLGCSVTQDEIEVHDSYIGEGYAIPTREDLDAISLVAQTEGIFLDPVYSGRAMAGLIDLIKKKRFKPTDTIIFLHTGGIPAMFAYHEEITSRCSNR